MKRIALFAVIALLASLAGCDSPTASNGEPVEVGQGSIQGKVLLDGPTRQILGQADILAQAHVEPPQIMRLSEQLHMKERPLNVDEFIEFWYP